MDTLTREQRIQKVASLSWFHTIDLGNGIVTPGKWPRSKVIVEAMDTVDFTGKRVLDIGCLDGLWSFEAERRGASAIMATDDISQRGIVSQPTTEVARDILGSRVEYHGDISVYDLIGRFPPQSFDVVMFFGVYYHLKDPLLALSQIRNMLRRGGRLLIEGEGFLDREDASATFYYSDTLAGDHSNWWVPTLRCLREWVECSFFEIQTEHIAGPPVPRRRFQRWRRRLTPRRRIALSATAIERADPRYKSPDHLLAAFDRNAYP